MNDLDSPNAGFQRKRDYGRTREADCRSQSASTEYIGESTPFHVSKPPALACGTDLHRIRSVIGVSNTQETAFVVRGYMYMFMYLGTHLRVWAPSREFNSEALAFVQSKWVCPSGKTAHSAPPSILRI